MRLLVAAGVVAIAVGFVALVDRGVAAALDPSTVVVTLIGLLGVVQGVRHANGRRHRERRTTETGEPERRRPATVPGEDLDRLIARVSAGARGSYRSRSELRDRVRVVAVATVARERNRSTPAAERAVESGSWTTDPTAAAFLSPDAAYPLRVRLRVAVSGRSRYETGLRAAVDAIERIDSAGGREPEKREAENREAEVNA